MDIDQARIICVAAGRIPPPLSTEQTSDGVFDFRHPGDREACTETTPTSFRWRFRDGKLKAFCGYGWHRRMIGYGRTKHDPEWGYSLLPVELRDEAAKELMEIAPVAVDEPKSVTVDAPGALPCPFCGSADVHNWASNDHGPGTWSMMCFGCECEGPHTDSQQQSIDMWNQRVPLAIAPVAAETLYRSHRGGLHDSMETVRPVKGFDDLVAVLRQEREGWPDQSVVTSGSVLVKPYGFDERIGWDTHVVTVAGRAVGFTNGPLS